MSRFVLDPVASEEMTEIGDRRICVGKNSNNANENPIIDENPIIIGACWYNIINSPISKSTTL